MKKNKKIYLVSGIPPGKGGVGELMTSLVDITLSYNVSVITRPKEFSLVQRFRNKEYLSALFGLLTRVVGEAVFKLRIRLLSKKKVLIVHPQNIGFRNIQNILQFNEVYWYVMDNSFFCVRSYNTHPKKNMECLDCLQRVNLDSGCAPFPRNVSLKHNLDFLEFVKKRSKNIEFWVQNDTQEKLVRKHFGVCKNVEVVGLPLRSVFFTETEPTHSKQYDFVYHGALNIAKGLAYYIELAKTMRDYTFMIPGAMQDCERVLMQPLSGVGNLFFDSCEWNSGLKSHVESCRIVFNPSVWSAPIEGALLKSLYWGKKVAVIDLKYGYINDISSKNLLRLPVDTHAAAATIVNYLNKVDSSTPETTMVEQIICSSEKKLGECFDRLVSSL